jgi:predicted nucleic acid-binding protein
MSQAVGGLPCRESSSLRPRLRDELRVFARPWGSTAAWRFLDTLPAAPGFEILTPTPRHRAVLSQTLAESPECRANLVHDLHTAVLLREHGVGRIYPRVADFHRFSFLTVVDPLRIGAG